MKNKEVNLSEKTLPAKEKEPFGPIRICVFLGVLAILASGWVLYAPWWNAGTTPVIVRAFWPEDARVLISAGPDKLQYPLVPGNLVSGEGPFTDASREWLAEIPPRLEYRIVFHFKTPIDGENSRIVDWRMLDLSDNASSIAVAPFSDTEAWAASGGLKLRACDSGAAYVTVKDSGQLAMKSVLDRRTGWFSPDGLRAGLAGLALASILFAGIASPLRYPRKSQYSNNAEFSISYPEILLLFFILSLSLFHVFLTWSVPVEFWPYDSTSYLHKALGYLENGSYETGGFEYEINRLPGTPLFEAAVFTIWGRNLDYVARVQAVLFVLSAGGVLWALRKRISVYLLVLASPLVLLSPAALWASKTFSSEAPFLIGIYLTFFCWLKFISATGPVGRFSSWAGFCLFTVFACLTRPNGLILLTLPLLPLLRDLMVSVKRNIRKESPEKMLNRRSWIFYGFPVILVLASWSLWGFRNHVSRNYFAPTDLAPVAGANAPFAMGWFDPVALLAAEDKSLDARLLNESELYREVLRKRREQKYWYHGWHLRHGFFVRDSDSWSRLGNDLIGKTALRLKKFSKANRRAAPFPALLRAWAMAGYLSLFPADEKNFILEPISKGFQLGFSVKNKHGLEHIQNNIQWAASQFDTSVGYTSSRPPLEILNHVNFFFRHFESYLAAMAILGIVAYLVSALRGYRTSTWMLGLFYANIVIVTITQYPAARYVVIPDGFLVLGILCTVEQIFRRGRKSGKQWTSV